MGFEMAPLSLMHCFVLMGLKSPLVDPSTKETSLSLESFITAACVCSLDYDGLVAFLDNPNRGNQIGEWHDKIKKESPDFLQEIENFVEWFVAESKPHPRYEMRIQNGKPRESTKSVIPWPLRIAWALMARLEERRAWSMPIGMAMSLYAAAQEENGDDMLIAEDDE
jgi:hypothetical protein